MASQRVTRVLCAADPGGSADPIERLLEAATTSDVQALAVVGGLKGSRGDGDGYRAVFRALGNGGLPTYWVPGPRDAPIADYLREAQNIEVVLPDLHGVHGTAAFAPDGHVVFAGMGGEVVDDPGATREELDGLRYPGWEVGYRLKLLHELDEHRLILLFASQPAHKGHDVPGSEVLAELVGTHRPRLVVCGGERRVEVLGPSLVVAPGSLGDGHYAVADIHSLDVEVEQLPVAA